MSAWGVASPNKKKEKKETKKGSGTSLYCSTETVAAVIVLIRGRVLGVQRSI